MKKFTDKINESVEEKIPTASEWLESFGADADDMYYKSSVEEAMIEFAKLHVKEALRVAAYSAEIESCGNPYDPSDDSQCVNKESIVNSYPLENIK
jgi:hypothetical protein